MKPWEGLTFGLAVATLVALPAGDAVGAQVSGRASTVIEWYEDLNDETIVPAYQYLQLNALDLGGQGYDFHFYGRAGDDLAGKRGSRAKSRLYFAYLEKRGFYSDALDVRLGRQFISTTAGASIMDGLRLDYGFRDNYRLTFFGGGDVTYYQGYNTKDAITGGEIAGEFLDRDLQMAFSYLSKWDEGRLSHELFGLNVEYDWRKSLYLYNETQFDYLSDRISYFLAGAKYHRSPVWSARLEYLYSLPVFAATSIYSVFAVDEYQEVLGELTYTVAPGWRAFGRYTNEIYQDISSANVFEAGVEKFRTRTEQWGGYLSLVWRDHSDGQDLKGFKARLSYLCRENLLAGVGTEIDVLDRQVDFFDIDSTTDEVTSRRYWVDVTYTVTPKINVQGKVERIESDLWDYYHRGRIRLNYLF